jgi:hypothetical protein
MNPIPANSCRRPPAIPDPDRVGGSSSPGGVASRTALREAGAFAVVFAVALEVVVDAVRDVEDERALDAVDFFCVARFLEGPHVLMRETVPRGCRVEP